MNLVTHPELVSDDNVRAIGGIAPHSIANPFVGHKG